jgi:hypothetical protein
MTDFLFRKRVSHSKRRLALLLAACAVLSAQAAKAQNAPLSATDIAKLVQNPLADAIMIPFANDTNFGFGPYRQAGNVLNIQPVIPVHINDDWNLITRTTIPLMRQVRLSDTEGPRYGVGDIVPILALSPSHAGPIIWGVGPTFSLPTATNPALGTRKWSAGPAVIALVMPDPWVFGLLLTQTWSFAGSHQTTRVSRMAAQYFMTYNLPDGWFVGSTPIISADWTERGRNRWTVPFGADLGRAFAIGDQPVSAALGAYYNAVRPENGPKWQLRFNMTFLFAK